MLIRNLSEVKNPLKTLGGKGASLARLAKAGLPTPKTVVLSTSLFDQLFKKNKLNKLILSELSNLDITNVDELERFASLIQKKILSINFSSKLRKELLGLFDELNTDFLAVRSSAVVEDGLENSWAGQLNSFLNTTKDNLLVNIKLCWASLYSPRAITYLFEKKFNFDSLSMAVVVQEMINGEKAGVGFSIHPSSFNKRQTVIEAGFGLGEAVVSGEITPDRYILNKESGKLINSSVGHQKKKLVKSKNKNIWRSLTSEKFPILSTNELLELNNLIKEIEALYNLPVDVEWIILKSKLFISQARPITVLTKPDKSLVETFFELVAGEKIFQCMDTNIFPETVVWTKRNFLKDFYSAKTPLNFIILMMGNRSVAYYQEKIWDDIGDEFTELYLTKNPKAMLAINEFLSNKKEMDELYDIYSYEKITSTSFSQLQILMHRLIYLMEPKFFANTSKEFCQQFLTDLSVEELDEIWSLGVIPAIDSFDVRQKRLILKDILDGKNIFENLEKYQYFFTGLTSVLNLDLVKKKLIKEFKLTKTQARSMLDALVNKSVHSFNAKYINLTYDQMFVVDFLQKMIELRDLRKDLHNKGITLFYRIATIHIFNPLSIDEKYLQFVSYTELLKPLGYFKTNKDEIQRRVNGFGLLIKNDGSEVKSFVDFKTDKLLLDDYIDSSLLIKDESDIIKGFVASQGLVIGKVRIITSVKEEGSLFKEGEILVTGMTRPEYLPLARKASGIITDEGGITSHAAIIARELNKPCITGTNNATRILKTGDLVELNADLGIVRKL